MAQFGLCGPSYQSQSPMADPEDCINWYPEAIEAPLGKSAFVLYPSPGLTLAATLTDSPYRGGTAFTPSGSAQRAFAVYGSTLFEFFANNTFANRGAVVNDGKPASFAYNQANQLMVASGGTLYCFNLSTNGFAAVPGLNGPVSQVGFANGYFIAVLAGTNKYQVSLLLDGTTWTGIGPVTNEIQSFADAIQGAMISDHNEPWFFSGTRGIGYYNSGPPNIFDPIGASSFTEDGLGAGSSLVRADNTFFWINASERGGGIAKRLNGNVPVRISNHAVEYQWSTYPTIADAQTFSFEVQGHTFLQFRFPSANGGLGVTWVYDVTTGMWHKRSFWDVANGRHKAHLAGGHIYAFGQHYVGDWTSGNLYTQSIGTFSDNGNIIRRVRISPPISQENVRIFHSQVQIDCEVGMGPIPPLTDGFGNPRPPQLSFSWTDTFGKTWSNEQLLNCGLAGEYLARAIARRLGQARTRSYRIVATDPVPWRIINGDLTAPGYRPTKRLAKQLAEAS